MGNDRGSRESNHTWSFTVADLEPLPATQVGHLPLGRRSDDEDEPTTVANPARVYEALEAGASLGEGTDAGSGGMDGGHHLEPHGHRAQRLLDILGGTPAGDGTRVEADTGSPGRADPIEPKGPPVVPIAVEGQELPFSRESPDGRPMSHYPMKWPLQFDQVKNAFAKRECSASPTE